jgi:uncharacterized repeat protein (TIGR01451 family)
VVRLLASDTQPLPKIRVTYQKEDGTVLAGGQEERVISKAIGGTGEFTPNSSPALLIPDFSAQNLSLANWRLGEAPQNNMSPGFVDATKSHNIVLVYGIAPAKVTKQFQDESGATVRASEDVSVKNDETFADPPADIADHCYVGYRIDAGLLQSGNPSFKVVGGQSYRVTYVYKRHNLLGITKCFNADQNVLVREGDPVTYTIAIENLSKITPLSDVTVSEQLTGGTWPNAQGFALPGATDGRLKADNFIIPDIAGGATLTVDYTVTADEGTTTNIVTACDNNGSGGHQSGATDKSVNVGILGKR